VAWAWEKGPEPLTPVSSAAYHKDAASPAASHEGDHLKQSLSVSEAVQLAKKKIDEIPELVVTGEVTGFRGPNARSGHCYFQIKDENAAMDVTMWRWVYQKLSFELKNGLQVQMAGSFQVYDKKGSLSFHANSVVVSGEGLLRQQVAELARALEREGLMDAARKRPIPRFCERVCVVTSLSGAVIDDVRRTLARRNPLVAVQEVGCMVQGEGAAATIIRALAVAAAAKPDAILLVRGGGSFEDLMTFNDEGLARAVAACPVPVICGIGHEPDTSICDMVADRRCSTPTAAAESVAPALDEVAGVLGDRQVRLAHALSAYIGKKKQQLDAVSLASTRSISFVLAQYTNQVNSLAAHRCLQDPFAFIRSREESWELSAERLHDALPRLLGLQHQRTDDMGRRLRDVGSRMLRPYQQRVVHTAATLDALSPLRVLSRGYAVVLDEQGHVVVSADPLTLGDNVELLFGKGAHRCTRNERWVLRGAASSVDIPRWVEKRVRLMKQQTDGKRQAWLTTIKQQLKL
jgi:exodeoxyribonuclease VII large subunit